MEEPYLKTEKVSVEYRYNPIYGDDRICKCGHSYYRHFDSYENMLAIGCKYCDCMDFIESSRNDEAKKHFSNQSPCIHNGPISCSDCTVKCDMRAGRTIHENIFISGWESVIDTLNNKS